MNIGLIAHDSKKKLMNYMQQERQEGLWRRLPI